MPIVSRLTAIVYSLAASHALAFLINFQNVNDYELTTHNQQASAMSNGPTPPSKVKGQ